MQNITKMLSSLITKQTTSCLWYSTNKYSKKSNVTDSCWGQLILTSQAAQWQTQIVCNQLRSLGGCGKCTVFSVLHCWTSW